MKKRTLIIAMVLLSHFFAISQGCLPEGITFTTQAQIDNFQANFPGCTELEVDVHIFSYFFQNDKITNLNGLDELNSIGSDLIILSNYSLNNLTGLEGLTSIGGDLTIGEGCEALVSSGPLTKRES